MILDINIDDTGISILIPRRPLTSYDTQTTFP